MNSIQSVTTTIVMIIGPSQLIVYGHKINILHEQTLWLQEVSSELDADITSAMERDIKSVSSLRLGAVAKIWAERVAWEVSVSGVELLGEVVAVS